MRGEYRIQAAEYRRVGAQNSYTYAYPYTYATPCAAAYVYVYGYGECVALWASRPSAAEQHTLAREMLAEYR